jgi:feruloyl esterase
MKRIISTSCNSNRTCVLEPLELVEDWIRLFVLKDASADLTNLTHEDLDRLTHLSSQTYDSIIGTNDPDLSAFRNRGGKLIGYHGTVS